VGRNSSVFFFNWLIGQEILQEVSGIKNSRKVALNNGEKLYA
jgi:hypothetical protein